MKRKEYGEDEPRKHTYTMVITDDVTKMKMFETKVTEEDLSDISRAFRPWVISKVMELIKNKEMEQKTQ